MSSNRNSLKPASPSTKCCGGCRRQWSGPPRSSPDSSSDSSNRDRAIRGPIILNSATDEFEFITFTVTEAVGLEGPAAVGDTLTFTLIGDLTIRDQTNEVEFAVTASLLDDSTVQGTATTDVLRSDFGIGIPNVASVTDVTDEVSLQLEIVATSS